MIFRTMTISFLLVIAFQARAQLTINISNISIAEGELYIAVYDHPEKYMNPESATERKIVPVKGKSASVVVDDLPRGKYAVAVFHDLNANGILDMKKGKIPGEPFGFSNDARGKTGPPNFDKASFEYHGNAEIDIKLVNNDRK